ncbi:hypothetical protein [Escherichia phage phiWec190]|jgi:hypothetical protein|uniref:hypothetical protein n=1 Tax=Escherichia coli TaxID=562 RepID=UPI001FF5A1E5|nr:hypothetical protein [Escherichia coli]BDU12021.1 hypothetical protein [Escherichia phage phiWec179]BDU12539.1 hypothetical protein [Escherichia phage phiWec181]BDU12684.1 hypothetical protein [Escherichia phage phiWec186]BDU13193.1 hypothetical protein [Escherichia phage phiWec188]BDU13710.1 hypothetical protein [Escherichia phage phiWec190]
MPKLKRGRGRPTAEMQQIYAMDAAQATVKELFAENYLAAMKYIVELVYDNEAAKPLRFQAAKAIKEQVEDWLEEHYEAMEEETPTVVEEQPKKIVI